MGAFAAELVVINIIKGMLAIVTLLSIVAFYVTWKLSKTRLSAAEFYARSKLVKHKWGIAAGVGVLSIAFLVGAAVSLGYYSSPEATLLTNVLELLALCFLGYWYYARAREEG